VAILKGCKNHYHFLEKILLVSLILFVFSFGFLITPSNFSSAPPNIIIKKFSVKKKKKKKKGKKKRK
jgi:hypothetical protein